MIELGKLTKLQYALFFDSVWVLKNGLSSEEYFDVGVNLAWHLGASTQHALNCLPDFSRLQGPEELDCGVLGQDMHESSSNSP